MATSTTGASYSKAFNPAVQGRGNRNFRSVGRSGPQIVTDNLSAAASFQSPTFESNGTASSSGSMYVPWADQHHSISILPTQALDGSFQGNNDLDASFYPDHSTTRGYQYAPINTMGHNLSSSFLSSSDMPISSMASAHGASSYSASPTLMTKHGGGVLTPDLSPEPMSLSPLSENQWSFGVNGRVEAPRTSLNKAARSISPVSRPDCLRKKNAKVEIPQERTLETIDTMISSAKCDDVVKELKAQKRLLKNREAALQSRQRKKQHTENLEGEKKNFMVHMTGLEKSLTIMKATNQQLEHEKLQLEWQRAEVDKHVEVLQTENIKLKHQVSSLREVLQPPRSSPTSSNPSSNPTSTTFGDYPDDMNPITFNTNEWIRMIGDPSFDAVSGTAALKRDVSLGTAMSDPAQSLHGSATTGKMVASRLLLVLVMAGALIKTSQDPERAIFHLIGQLPNDFKGVAVKVLDNIMQSGDFRILECLPALRAQSLELGTGELDQLALDMILTMQHGITHDVVRELNILVARGMTTRHDSNYQQSMFTKPFL